MCENRGFPSPAELLSIGNIVSATVRLYFFRLKTYLEIVFTTHLCALLTIYSWAK